MRFAIMTAIVLACGLMLTACGTDSVNHSVNHPADSNSADTGGAKSGASALERPGITRLPTDGLPAELKPPK